MQVNLHRKDPENIKYALAAIHNLYQRMEQNERTGLFKLPGNITPNEIRSLKLLYNIAAEKVEEPII